MKPSSCYLTTCALLAFSGTLFAAQPSDTRATAAKAQSPSTSAARCTPAGDGTFADIVTTMASVLPADQANALLDKHCSPCMKQCLKVSSAP